MVGNAIMMLMKDLPLERPQTHDLFGHVLEALGAKVQRVVINDLKSTKVKPFMSEPISTLPNQVQIGIESIVAKNDKVKINVYALNEQPIAGVQLEINPSDIF